MRKTSQTGVETDELLPVAHRRDQRGRSGYQLRPMVGGRINQRNGESGSLPRIQPTVCAQLARIKEAPSGNTIQEPPLPIWANFRQRALDTGISEINEKTDLNISLESLERSKHRRVDRVDFYD
jgi:hypothetical protein